MSAFLIDKLSSILSRSLQKNFGIKLVSRRRQLS